MLTGSAGTGGDQGDRHDDHDDGDGDDEQVTRFSFLGFKGEWMPLNREPVHVLYEAAANPSDHPPIVGTRNPLQGGGISGGGSGGAGSGDRGSAGGGRGTG